MGMAFWDIVKDSFDKGHSDIHFKQGVGIFYRKGKRLFKDVEVAVDNNELGNIMRAILSTKQLESLEKDRKIDLGHQSLPQVRVRGNIFYQQEFLAGVFRLIPTKIPTLNELGLPDIVKQFAKRPRGLVLVSGPAGSGTTTTAAALVQEVNSATTHHIICVEDPIEYIYKDVKSVITQREVGTSTVSFQHALKAALREDPDVVFIGEMRDLDTFETAITMAETGHLVISTVHTIGACEVIDRIVNVFPPNLQPQIRTQLSLNIQGIVSQLLLPRADGNGVVLAAEIFNPTFALRALIRKGEVSKLKSAVERAVNDGCMPMGLALRKLLEQKVITKEVYQKTVDDYVGS